MLTLLLSAQDGGNAWRHLLAEGEARAGFEPVGPLGLVRRVGRILGVPTEMATAPERLASYGRRLDAHDDRSSRSYSASRKQDPFGVARYLLGLRDVLRLLGWDGRALDGSARLVDLAALEQLAPALPPGLPDVVAELTASIVGAGKLSVPVRIKLCVSRNAFPPLLRRLLEALAKAGATVVDPGYAAALAPADTDLGIVQRALLGGARERPALEGDGTFVVLEADTPLEAAELTGSLARTRPLQHATFVVPTEPATIDAALARQGLPTLGVPSASHLRPHLQVLPLRLALAFAPQDPFRAAELLLLPGGPLPGHAQRALLEALGQMPGVGSPAWRDAVEKAVAAEVARASADGKEASAAAARGTALRERIDAWFGGELHSPAAGIPAPTAAALCAKVATWAGGRVKGALDRAAAEPDSGALDDSALWSHAAAVARTLEQLLVARPPGELLPQQSLMQLHELAVGNGSELAAFDGESGRPAVVSHPGAVTAPCPEIVWWGFVADADPGPPPDPWTGAEREALQRAGVALPGPGEQRGLEAEGWRRPILAARERATLVRWRLAGTDTAGRHPLLDELTTRLADGALGPCTVTSEHLFAGTGAATWNAATVEIAPATVMTQRPAWKVPPQTLVPAGTLSSTSLDAFLGCPFKWALRYQAQLKPGEGVNLPEGQRLLGDFAHRVLQDMLCGEEKLDFAAATREDARAWARKAFDARVGLEAARLVRRGGEVELDRARTVVATAAASLLEFLKRSGWRPVDAEREVKGSFAGLPSSGYVDLVVEKEGEEAIVDLKLSGLKYRQEELERGQALQIALYASLLGKRGTKLPPTGFFVLDEGQLLTTDGKAFAGATLVDGPGAQETLNGSEEGFRYWQKVLAAGLVPSMQEGIGWEAVVTPAAGPPPDEDSLARRPPPCRFCDFKALCVPPAPDDEEVTA
jgi:ATP-dependent helicase/nuclease subunit B